ncbi:MAG: hypothetical protein WBE18_00505 [Gammaproteobacteria bacterium]
MNIKRILLLSAWVTLGFATLLIIFATAFNSDSIFVETVSRDLFSLGGAWHDWRFIPSPSFFPEMMLYFLAYKLFPFVGDRSLFISVIEALLIGGVAIWLAKKIKQDLSVQAKVCLLALVTFVSLVAANSGMMMYFSKNNNHISSLLFFMLSLGFLIQYLTTARKFYLVLLLIAAIIAIPCDMIYVISFQAPAFIVLTLILLVLQYKYDFPVLKKRVFIGLLTLIVAFPLGKLLSSFLAPNNDATTFGANHNPVAIGRSLAIFIQAAYDSLLPDNKYTFTFSILLIIAFIYIVILFLKGLLVKYEKAVAEPSTYNLWIGFNIKSADDYKLAFCGLFLIVLLLFNVGGIILEGVGDPQFYRYFMAPMAFIFILAVINLDRKVRFIRSKYSYLLLFGVLAVFWVLGAITIIKDLKGKNLLDYRIGFHTGGDYAGDVTHCLEQLDNKPIHLRSGVGEYWRAHSVTNFLKNKNFILAVNGGGKGDFRPYFWLATKGPVVHPDRYHIYYNFVILNTFSDPGVNFSLNADGKYLPSGYSRHICPNIPFEIWVYAGNQLDNFMRASNSQFLFERGEVNQVTWVGLQLPGKIGRTVGNARVANSKEDSAGVLALGPSVTLPKGKYTIDIHYSANNANPNQAVGTWSVGKYDDPNQLITLAKGSFPQAQDVISIDIDIPQKKLYGVSVRVWFTGQGSLTISSIVIKKR